MTYHIPPLQPLSRLEVPPGVNNTCSPPDLLPKMERSISEPENFDMPAIGKFIREKSNSFFVAITKRLSSLRDGRNNNEDEEAIVKPTSNVMKFNLVGLKVIKSLKELDKVELKGRIDFFSRSNCRDCTTVRFFTEII
ncbi:uncharacterized protein Fot_24303 [Forsythia ovata]|uniref:Uncharacterized protein n=1 Tax=Forsythia ovata TaxID=205694 RepID=A0ABD1U5T2_9LAMI